MMLIILTGLIALTSAAQLPSRSYLPQGQGGSGQSFHSSQSSSSFSAGGSSDNGNRRPQQDAEKNAVILNQDQEVSESGFRYGYETSNGIRAEESGNAAQTQGGFSYKGDDGNTYTITFTAGEGGFRPEGAHLPVPPPTPDEILVALRKNAEDEAKGIFDDGKYRAGNEGTSNQQSSFGSQSSFSSGSQSSFTSGSFNSNSGYHY